MKIKNLLISTTIAASSMLSINSFANVEIQPRVIGGFDSTESYPWMVSVTTESEGFLYHTCGGALIDKEWVLTAAHCVEDAVASNTYVIVGTRNRNNPNEGEQIQAESIITHECYLETSMHVDNDIALIKLSEPSNNPPISMATLAQSDALPEDTLLTLIGWGSMNYAPERDPVAEDYPEILQVVDIPLRTQTQCAELYSGIDGDIICAGAHEGGVDSCDGDSGGPLFIKQGNEYIHLGIVSYGDGCALEGKYGVYTKTAAYQDWISDQIPTLSANSSSVALSSASPSCAAPEKPSSSGGSVSWLLLTSFGLLSFRARKFK